MSASKHSGSEVLAQLGLRFAPFPGPSSSGDGVFGERGLCDLSPPRSLPLSFLPARFSGCKTGAASQADVDRPEPQEVLVSKEACLQFCR